MGNLNLSLPVSHQGHLQQVHERVNLAKHLIFIRALLKGCSIGCESFEDGSFNLLRLGSGLERVLIGFVCQITKGLLESNKVSMELRYDLLD